MSTPGTSGSQAPASVSASATASQPQAGAPVAASSRPCTRARVAAASASAPPQSDSAAAANHQRKGYMAVTAHYLDDDWKLKSFLIRFIYVPAPHTADAITEVLHDILIDWHIERNLSTITLNNCSTNDSLMKNLIGTNTDELVKTMAAIEEDWQFTKDLCDKLKMFYDVTELLSGTSYVTANLFFPKITNIYLATRKWQTCAIPKVEAWSRLDMLGTQFTFVGALMTCLEEEDEDTNEPESTIVD